MQQDLSLQPVRAAGESVRATAPAAGCFLPGLPRSHGFRRRRARGRARHTTVSGPGRGLATPRRRSTAAIAAAQSRDGHGADAAPAADPAGVCPRPTEPVPGPPPPGAASPPAALRAATRLEESAAGGGGGGADAAAAAAAAAAPLPAHAPAGTLRLLYGRHAGGRNAIAGGPGPRSAPAAIPAPPAIPATGGVGELPTPYWFWSVKQRRRMRDVRIKKKDVIVVQLNWREQH